MVTQDCGESRRASLPAPGSCHGPSPSPVGAVPEHERPAGDGLLPHHLRLDLWQEKPEGQEEAEGQEEPMGQESEKHEEPEGQEEAEGQEASIEQEEAEGQEELKGQEEPEEQVESEEHDEAEGQEESEEQEKREGQEMPDGQEESKGLEDPVVVDGGHGWLVVLGAFLTNMCIVGTVKSFGLINLRIIEMFNVSASETAVVTGMLLTTSLMISPLVGALCQRFTCRQCATFGGLLCFVGFCLSSLATSILQLCFTIGLLVGIGCGFITTPSILIATHYFPTRRSLVNGLVMAGNSAGSFVMPPLLQLLLEQFGLRGTLLVIGAICLHAVAGAALYRPIAQQERLLRNPLFMLVALSVFLMAAGSPYAVLQLPVFGVTRGLTPRETAEILSIVSAVDLASRLGFGWLLDKGFVRRQYALAASQLLAGGAVLVLPFCRGYGSILAMFLVCTIGMGAWFINTAPVMADHHGIEKIAVSFGLLKMFHGLSTLVMPPIFGAIADGTGDYGAQYFAIGACMASGGLVVLLIMVTGVVDRYGQPDGADTGRPQSKQPTAKRVQSEQGIQAEVTEGKRTQLEEEKLTRLA
ncbi:monocarboxylate transporter 13-like [Pollicipes pollicipes]|uniref:monocarboxylate transporter 13-like n=1 Tax=Pollicipes pollicipes TaxID=41117 RepID=UPI001885157F|nr:monocarboxylate transporter 13-like [Pollicipes pollicipes]